MTNQTLDRTRLESRLERIYGGEATADQTTSERVRLATSLIGQVLQKHADGMEFVDPTPASRWNEKDVVLITYGDQLRPDEPFQDSCPSQPQTPLGTLLGFLAEYNLFEKLNTIHFLPCFPYSSDDGFSVIDYRQIDPNLGTWHDIAAFRKHGRLMFDFVVNHVSQESDWFKRYLEDTSPYTNFFIEVDPNTDLSNVTRPRSLPLLSEFETVEGKRWLWTTFSRDQIDLNYASPHLLAEIVDILLFYIREGARIIRLDAIAYLWKKVGTKCIHLPQTHEVVKLLRDVVDSMAPHVLLLTETNVPHAENVSYFGDGDEAHMVYQFSLPPLILDAFLNEDAKPIKRWLSELESPFPGTTFFNFTASHDGIGVRPLEGLVSDQRLAALVEKVRQRGANIGTRINSDGANSPYELNVSYVDALGPIANEITVEQHCERVLSSQAIMLALQGMPAVYFHSLVGTRNDNAAVEESGIPRRINRRKFAISELTDQLQSNGLQGTIFRRMQRLLEIRRQQPAFHPDVEQIYVEADPIMFCLSSGVTQTATRGF